jgi:putative tricarboxylic transport membrane protein
MSAHAIIPQESTPMQPNDEPEGKSLISNRDMEIVVAMTLLAVSGVVIKDTLRLGIGWIEGQGPASGYFPFYIALALGLASLVTLVQAFAGSTEDADGSFVSGIALGRVMTVLIPSIGFVALIEYLGIYVASAIFILAFMLAIGREGVVRSVLVSVGVPFALFLMFEKWFLVPLPKGPLETLLGLN